MAHTSQLEELTPHPPKALEVYHLLSHPSSRKEYHSSFSTFYPSSPSLFPASPKQTHVYSHRGAMLILRSPGGLEQCVVVYFSNRSRRPRWPKWKSTRPESTTGQQLPGPHCSTSSWTTSARSIQCTSFLSRWLTPGVSCLIIIKQCHIANAALCESLSMSNH